MALAQMPVTLFTVVMGLSGLTLALRAGEGALGLTNLLSGGALVLTLAVFAVVALAYLAKALRYPRAVAAEWHNPVSLAFFPAISIALMLLSVILLRPAPGIAHGLFLLAVPLQLVLTLAVVSGWIGHRSFEHGHLTPAWFIPTVGNAIVAVAGVPLGHAEIGWFFTSAGLIFWVVLLTLVLNRLIFHDPLPARLQPTLVILIAPPAVGYLSWVSLVGEVDAFARVLLNVAYLFVLVVAVQVPRLVSLPFSLPFWALSFPLAAVTVASFSHAAATGIGGYRVIALALLAVLVVVVAGLLWRTGQAFLRGELFGG